MKNCLFCGKEITKSYWVRKSGARIGQRMYETDKRLAKKKFCNNICRSKNLSITNCGKNNYFYGKKLTPWNKSSEQELMINCGKGYLQVRWFDKNGVRQVMLHHRRVMEKALGRKLKREEVVHHIDGNKLNNDINNLKCFKNDTEHKKHHAELRRNKLQSA